MEPEQTPCPACCGCDCPHDDDVCNRQLTEEEFWELAIRLFEGTET